MAKSEGEGEKKAKKPEAAAPAKVEEPAPEQDQELVVSLSEAVAWVMRRCPYIQKTGKMKSFGKDSKDDKGGKVQYTYASEADVVSALNGLMADVGLVMIPTRMRITHFNQIQTQRGGAGNHVEVRVRYKLAWYNPEKQTTETMEVEALGAGIDFGDKAVAKAMTMAHKYALRQVFNLETGDDPDNTHSEHYTQASGQNSSGGPGSNGSGGANGSSNRGSAGRNEPETAAAHNAAIAAIVRCTNEAILKQYQANYQKRNFTKEQKQELDALLNDRVKKLRAAAEEAKRKDAAAADGRDEEWDEEPAE